MMPALTVRVQYTFTFAMVLLYSLPCTVSEAGQNAMSRLGLAPPINKLSPCYFAYGNTIVLHWGEIIPTGHFHTRMQLYPVGFRCIRQEVDNRLNRLVDCLCEIDWMIVPSKDKASDDKLKHLSLQDLATCAEYRARLRPVFRITVCWMVPATKR